MSPKICPKWVRLQGSTKHPLPLLLSNLDLDRCKVLKLMTKKLQLMTPMLRDFWRKETSYEKIWFLITLKKNEITGWCGLHGSVFHRNKQILSKPQSLWVSDAPVACSKPADVSVGTSACKTSCRCPIPSTRVHPSTCINRSNPQNSLSTRMKKNCPQSKPFWDVNLEVLLFWGVHTAAYM